MTLKRYQCTWFTQSLGYVHKTCHFRWHLLKIKSYNPQHSVAIFSLNFRRTLIGITFKELNPTQIPYKHHISAFYLLLTYVGQYIIDIYYIYTWQYKKFYAWSTIVYICPFINISGFCGGIFFYMTLYIYQTFPISIFIKCFL